MPANTFVATAEAVCASARGRGSSMSCPTPSRSDPDAVAAAIGPAHSGHHGRPPVRPDGRRRAPRPARRSGTASPSSRTPPRRTGPVSAAAGPAASAWPPASASTPARTSARWATAAPLSPTTRRWSTTIRQLANHGRSEGGRYLHEVRGRNSRLDALQAAFLTAKLARLDAGNQRRRSLVQRYRDQLPGGLLARAGPAGRAGAPPGDRPRGRPRRGDEGARRRGDRLGCPLPGALPPAAGVRGVRRGAAAGRRARGRADPVAADVPDADRATRSTGSATCWPPSTASRSATGGALSEHA